MMELIIIKLLLNKGFINRSEYEKAFVIFSNMLIRKSATQK
jgi:hypothetical protein